MARLKSGCGGAAVIGTPLLMTTQSTHAQSDALSSDARLAEFDRVSGLEWEDWAASRR
jgi:hypothetical protein